MLNKTTLYSKSAHGKLRFWEIWSEGDIIYMEYGNIDGESIINEEHIPCGLANRTLEEQINLRINSRINKKKDEGYVESKEDALNNIKTNSLGFKKPAKCHSWNKYGHKFPFSTTYIQHKLDGHHCNIICIDGKNIAYSSNGKIIDTIPEILQSIEIPEGMVIEGELYSHGTPLQTISSWVRRRQDNTKKLHYFIYDIDLQECYSRRFELLNQLKINNEFCSIMPSKIITGNFDVNKYMKAALEERYEGLVLRSIGFPHMDGKRSKGMLKVKSIHFKGEFAMDDEFLVVNILSSVDGFARLQCETIDGNKFMVLCHGTHEYKKHVLENKKEFLFRHVRIEYSGWTKDKKPFHPVALEWREKFEE